MKKKYIWIAAAIVAAGGIYYQYSNSQSLGGQVEHVTSVTEVGILTSSVSASGNMEVDQLATVDPTISGTVQNLAVSVGDEVRDGQTLFKIDNDQLGVTAAKTTASSEQSNR